MLKLNEVFDEECTARHAKEDLAIVGTKQRQERGKFYTDLTRFTDAACKISTWWLPRESRRCWRAVDYGN